MRMAAALASGCAIPNLQLIKVVDIFAGPGGLSEGFSAVTGASGAPLFDVVLSIEMEQHAWSTLFLRKLFRQFDGDAPDEYYRCLRGEINTARLYDQFPIEATHVANKCWKAQLGPNGESIDNVRERMCAAISDDSCWVLVGGPPCQAYSLAGRSRNAGNSKYKPSKDERQRLYVEYLQILAEHRPAAFVMENVKGLLSATLKNERIFQRIVEDLSAPAAAIKREQRMTKHTRKGGYHIYSLVTSNRLEEGSLTDSVVRSEFYGIPQCRHRIILLGIRDDISSQPRALAERPIVQSSRVIGDLPRLRSGLSQTNDSPEAWRRCLSSQVSSRWVNAGAKRVAGRELSCSLKRILGSIAAPKEDRGGEYLFGEVRPKYAAEWFHDPKLAGVCNHSTRSHMKHDLFRYAYASAYAELFKISPTLKNFPTDLQPNHSSATEAVEVGGHFSDRFRVQLAGRPSTTIVSHISKDGHYYIHHDPSQCRSFTVREAARLQTFPDNYFFCGPRTAQYIQVGNAVPPLLAKSIGEIVADVLTHSR